MPRLVVGLNLGKEEKASSVLVACSFVSGSKSCGRSGPSGRSGSNNCCVGSQRSCKRQRSNRCGGSGGSNSWCCGSNNSNSKQINHSKGNSNINSFLSRAVSGSSSGSKNKMIVIMMILAQLW